MNKPTSNQLANHNNLILRNFLALGMGEWKTFAENYS